MEWVFLSHHQPTPGPIWVYEQTQIGPLNIKLYYSGRLSLLDRRPHFNILRNALKFKIMAATYLYVAAIRYLHCLKLVFSGNVDEFWRYLKKQVLNNVNRKFTNTITQKYIIICFWVWPSNHKYDQTQKQKIIYFIVHSTKDLQGKVCFPYLLSGSLKTFWNFHSKDMESRPFLYWNTKVPLNKLHYDTYLIKLLFYKLCRISKYRSAHIKYTNLRYAWDG